MKLLIHFFIVHKLDLNSDFTSKDCLFGGIKLAKMLIQINMYVLVMVLDSIYVQNFHYLMVMWVKMLLFLELI